MTGTGTERLRTYIWDQSGAHVQDAVRRDAGDRQGERCGRVFAVTAGTESGEVRTAARAAASGGVRQSMAATRHRSTARRFVRSACRFMRSIVRTSGGSVSPEVRILRRLVRDTGQDRAAISARAHRRGRPGGHSGTEVPGGRTLSSRVLRTPGLRGPEPGVRAGLTPRVRRPCPCTDISMPFSVASTRPASCPAGRPTIFRSKSIRLRIASLEAGDVPAGHLVGAQLDRVAAGDADRAGARCAGSVLAEQRDTGGHLDPALALVVLAAPGHVDALRRTPSSGPRTRRAPSRWPRRRRRSRSCRRCVRP